MIFYVQEVRRKQAAPLYQPRRLIARTAAEWRRVHDYVMLETTVSTTLSPRGLYE